MKKSKVFFYPTNNNTNNFSKIARDLLEKLVKEEKIIFEKEIPIKVHTGQPRNVTFIRPNNFTGIINFLLENNIKTFFTETGMVTGPRSKGETHRIVAKKHGFTQIPFIVADGEDGKDHVEVKIKTSKYFKSCMIARKLAKSKQIIVLNHFKGHIDAGFGAAIKMLGIGFASRQGKIHVHSKSYKPSQKTIDWSQNEKQYHGTIFRERMVEYALSAVKNKKNIYINFATAIVDNCDCDGVKMIPIYDDLGIFASTDPVAIDKACFDLLEKREGRRPFDGEEIFNYAEKIGLGSTKYQLITSS